jgi:Trk K+ transport system NAD-binding subunit
MPLCRSTFRHIVGHGTEAEPLRQAGIETAVGIVAGGDNDTNNLSIAMTAKEVNPDLFVVVRQNRVANQVLFDAYDADFTMVPSRIVARECLALITSPLLARFLGWFVAGQRRVPLPLPDNSRISVVSACRWSGACGSTRRTHRRCTAC